MTAGASYVVRKASQKSLKSQSVQILRLHRWTSDEFELEGANQVQARGFDSEGSEGTRNLPKTEDQTVTRSGGTHR